MVKNKSDTDKEIPRAVNGIVIVKKCTDEAVLKEANENLSEEETLQKVVQFHRDNGDPEQFIQLFYQNSTMLPVDELPIEIVGYPGFWYSKYFKTKATFIYEDQWRGTLDNFKFEIVNVPFLPI